MVPLDGERRLALAQLADVPIPPAAAHRVAQGNGRPWFFDRRVGAEARRVYEPEAGW